MFKDTIFSKDWWMAAGNRAIKTMAQSAVAVLGSGYAGLMDVNWGNFLCVVGLAGFLSLCTSLAGLKEVNNDNE